MTKLNRIAGLILVLVIAHTAAAQSDVGFKGAGLKFGLVDPDNVGSTFGFGAILDLGRFSQQIAFDANVDYWSKSANIPYAEASLRDLSFGGTVRYLFTTSSPRLQPYALGGLSLHLLESEATLFGESFSVNETRLGLDLGGGLDYALAPGLGGIVELRYRVVNDISQLSLGAGLIKRFGL